MIVCCQLTVLHSLECVPSPTRNGQVVSRQLPAPTQAIIPSLHLKCEGLITGGNIQVIGDLNLDLQIWRPQENTTTFYNLIWRRQFRKRASGSSIQVNATFTSSPGVPIRPGDVLGIHSFVSTRLLFDTTQQQQVYFVGAPQGPLCNFSLDGPGVMSRVIPLPLISLTYGMKICVVKAVHAWLHFSILSIQTYIIICSKCIRSGDSSS